MILEKFTMHIKNQGHQIKYQVHSDKLESILFCTIKYLSAVDIKYARAVREINHESYEMPPEMKKLIKIDNQ